MSDKHVMTREALVENIQRAVSPLAMAKPFDLLAAVHHVFDAAGVPFARHKESGADVFAEEDGGCILNNEIHVQLTRDERWDRFKEIIEAAPRPGERR